MKDISLAKPNKFNHWFQIYRLYISAFPAAERKPFPIIIKMYRKGKADIWCIRKNNAFAGIATTINGDSIVLLDYLAVDEKHRNSGVGSAALNEFIDKYKDKGVFLEIESPYDETADREERLRRKSFYLNNGLKPFNVMVRLFGVKMELLGINCWLDYNEYKRFYCENYTPLAEKYISPEKHPVE